MRFPPEDSWADEKLAGTDDAARRVPADFSNVRRFMLFEQLGQLRNELEASFTVSPD